MKCVVITARARSEEDFGLLTKMLDALGFPSRELEEYGNFRLKPFLPSELILEVVHREDPRVYPDLELAISDPDGAAGILKKMGLETVWDNSGPEPKHSSRDFYVRLPGGTNVLFRGFRTGGFEPEHGGAMEGALNGRRKNFGIVVSRFNSFITERLLAGCVDGLRRSGAAFPKGYAIIRVPGAFEIPSAARTAAETKKYDAIICLGCLLRGDTAHYDVIVNEVTRGIGQSAQETGVPHAFGVLTCDTLEQAIDRAGLKMGNKGFEAALAAVEMANLKKAISSHASKKALSSQLSAVSKTKTVSGSQFTVPSKNKVKPKTSASTKKRKSRR